MLKSARKPAFECIRQALLKTFWKKNSALLNLLLAKNFLRGRIEGETVDTVRKLPAVESLHCWISIREVRDCCCTGRKSASERCFWTGKKFGKRHSVMVKLSHSNILFKNASNHRKIDNSYLRIYGKLWFSKGYMRKMCE
jgi:hypothetical protein